MKKVYFLVSGRVNLITTLEAKKVSMTQSTVLEPSKDEKKKFIFKSMVSGSYFGEIEIMLKRRRDYDAVCEVECELYYLSRYDFENVLSKEFPHVAEEMKRTAQKREKINKDSVQEIANLLTTAKQLTIGNDIEKNNKPPIESTSVISNKLESKRTTKNLSPRDFTEAAADTVLNNEEFPMKRISLKTSESLKQKNSLREDMKRISFSKDVDLKFERTRSFSRDKDQNSKNVGDSEELTNLKKYAEEQFSRIREEIQESERRTAALEEKMQAINFTLSSTVKLVKDLVAKKRAET